MGFLDSLKKAIAGPPHISGADDPGEMAAALHEEYAVPNADEEEVREIHDLNDESVGPVAAAPFAGAGQIRASELEAEIIKPEDVTPDETEVTSDEDLIDPNR